MLVLSRKKNEEIVIGDDITITVIEIRRDKVRLGITAPKSMLVHRSEVADRIESEGPTRIIEVPRELVPILPCAAD